jgi:geranylgeranyl transferase type-2 subunit beta
MFPGGFGAHPDHDAHLLSTCSAIQILVMQDALDKLDIPRVVNCTFSSPDPCHPNLSSPFARLSYCVVTTAIRRVRGRLFRRD